MKKHMYFVQSLRHFLTKMTPPFTREAFWQVRILWFRQFYHPDKLQFIRILREADSLPYSYLAEIVIYRDGKIA